MAETMIAPPRTLMEVYQMLPEGTLAELIDNKLYMSPSPFTNHQEISVSISSELHFWCKKKNLGKVYTAPCDVYLDETSNAVQPDIIVVLNDQLDIINTEGHIHGIPAMLVEILSPGNKSHDLITKKDLYERFGVKEYHIVDPETKLVITFEPVEGRYQKSKELIGKLSSSLLGQEFEF
ncbi:Uma2 family endonuclease [Chitinophagaceae bacterium LB-8]|uniref:Uma2 family endonuclease n=1 Tax=Paraflavisolibacter caeni TaxID=2982496 RepID=A0A9X2XVP3_9BACT|nr:Uma2 family endonuclease [Paraflavisolibacter caeni]MCU7550046.1 Uma2 family endonuclease [Paraflavisolibacter caeni]